MTARQKILFLCTGNASRSQMAEGLMREISDEAWECLSAGSQPAGWVHPLAIEAMHEIGLDISGHRSKSIDEFLPAGRQPDLIVAVCDSADRECPVFPATVERIHSPFPDPGHVDGTHAERLEAFRQVRDDIRLFLTHFLAERP